ncbi:MAG: site-2 protease family protein [Spirochaetaceae bacterium]|nr:MAG: site-2 protease family protein [Spirochaetaceae bacterium]
MDLTTNPAEMILAYVILVLSVGMHEAAHAKIAKLFGDTQPAQDGFDTWNPIPHIKRSLFTCVLLPAITWFTGQFFMGGAYVRLNPANMKPQRLGYAASVAAGPLMNLVLSGLFLVLSVAIALITKNPTSSAVFTLLYVGGFNLIMFIFNLLPVPPLDGSSIITAIFPQTTEVFRRMGSIGFLALFMLLSFSREAAEIIFYPFTQYMMLAFKIIVSIMGENILM